MEDKYPTEKGRRRFVKGVVGSAALAGVGTGSAAVVGAATTGVGAGGGATSYFGIENVRGPAPRGMPQIPIEIDSEGYLKGIWPDRIDEEADVAVTTIGGREYKSSWFQYCGVQTYPGADPAEEQDDFLRSARRPPYEWQSGGKSPGDRLHVDDFSDYGDWGNGIGESGVGKPAMAFWRSRGVPVEESMPVQVLRSTRVEELRRDPPQGTDGDWIRATTTEEGFIAWLDKCTHFCCVPGFKTYADSAKFNGEDRVYCQCHQSVYDPFSVVEESFFALPRPEEG